MFYNQWIKVKKASEPDEIKWENLGISKLSRCLRRTCVWIFAILILIVAIIGMVQFKVHSDEAVVNGIDTKYECPQEVTKEVAYQAYTKSSTGLIHCFCMSQATSDPTGFLDIKFSDGSLLCKEWLF